MRRNPVALVALSSIIGVAPAVAEDALEGHPRGAQLFEDYCARCHRAGPDALKAAPDEIAGLLGADTVRAHRFELEPSQVDALVAYLRAHAGAETDSIEPQP